MDVREIILKLKHKDGTTSHANAMAVTKEHIDAAVKHWLEKEDILDVEVVDDGGIEE